MATFYAVTAEVSLSDVVKGYVIHPAWSVWP